MMAVVGPLEQNIPAKNNTKGSTEADGEVIEAEDQPRENEQ